MERDLSELIATLSPEQQAAVEEFIKFLKSPSTSQSSAPSFREALDSFTRQHEALLRRLAQ